MNEIDLNQIAYLAFLKLSDAEMKNCEKLVLRMTDDAQDMLQSDLSGVPPTTKMVKHISYREDVVIPSSPRDDLLKNARGSANGAFVVPKIVD